MEDEDMDNEDSDEQNDPSIDRFSWERIRQREKEIYYIY